TYGSAFYRRAGLRQGSEPLVDTHTTHPYIRRLMTSRRAALLFSTLATLGAIPAADAYDFAVEASSIGQGYQVRWFRPRSGDLLLNRRRFTQNLELHLWNLLAPTPDPGHLDPQGKAPVDLYFTSSMRFDHDLGNFTRGQITYMSGAVPVTDAAT